MISALLFAWAMAALLMLAAWLMQRRTGNAGWVDVIWPLCMAAVAATYALDSVAPWPVTTCVLIMVAIWSLRLAGHVGERVLREPEDPRYQDLRRSLGRWEQAGLLLFYQMQALAALPLSLPWLIATRNTGDSALHWLALAWTIWLTAMAGEWLADRQLSRHRADPAKRGKTCRAGLWRYTRHPNYFFEWLHWLSYLPLCIGAPYAWLALLSPAVMIVLLVFITGIPHAERRALRSRGEDYRRYQQSTSAFFPWFPKEVFDERSH